MTITERQLKAGRLYWHKYANQRTYRHEKPMSCMLDIPFVPKLVRRPASQLVPSVLQVAESITSRILNVVIQRECGLDEAIREVLSCCK